MKKSFYNIFFGISSQFIAIIIGLMLPRLRIVSFGSEVNGMLSSVQQVYTYLALLEAGIGSAALQALYGPVAKKDYQSVNGVIAAIDHYYKKTGMIYLLSVIAFAVIYPLAVSSDIPKSTIISVIMLNGIGNVLSYFFQGKYRILLQAEGKQYVMTNLATFISVFSGLTKVGLILCGFSVVTLQFSYFLFHMVQVLFFSWYIHRYYSWINLKTAPDLKAVSQKNSALIHQIAQLVFYNTDVLILSLFCDLKIVSVYSLYNLIFEMIAMLMIHINSGFQYRLGQMFNVDRNRFSSVFSLYERYYVAVSFALYCVAYLLTAHFITLYTRNVTDINYSMPYLALLFTVIKLMISGRAPSAFLIIFAGHFKLTQNRAVLEMIINLLISVLAVRKWGIYGVLIGTIAALLYRANDMIIYASRNILFRSSWESYKWWLLDLAVFIPVAAVFMKIPVQITGYVSFFIIAAIGTIAVSGIYLGITFLFSSSETMPYIKKAAGLLKSKFK